MITRFLVIASASCDTNKGTDKRLLSAHLFRRDDNILAYVFWYNQIDSEWQKVNSDKLRIFTRGFFHLESKNETLDNIHKMILKILSLKLPIDT